MAVGKTRSFIGFCNHLPVGRPPFSASGGGGRAKRNRAGQGCVESSSGALLPAPSNAARPNCDNEAVMTEASSCHRGKARGDDKVDDLATFETNSRIAEKSSNRADYLSGRQPQSTTQTSEEDVSSAHQLVLTAATNTFLLSSSPTLTDASLSSASASCSPSASSVRTPRESREKGSPNTVAMTPASSVGAGSGPLLPDPSNQPRRRVCRGSEAWPTIYPMTTGLFDCSRTLPRPGNCCHGASGPAQPQATNPAPFSPSSSSLPASGSPNTPVTLLAPLAPLPPDAQMASASAALAGLASSPLSGDGVCAMTDQITPTLSAPHPPHVHSLPPSLPLSAHLHPTPLPPLPMRSYPLTMDDQFLQNAGFYIGPPPEPIGLNLKPASGAPLPPLIQVSSMLSSNKLLMAPKVNLKKQTKKNIKASIEKSGILENHLVS
ncbi:unnamed protein product [Protopolystoma xenopodis]|uniref:Uncharacterized protein n=1 Tax=Protopolystoma xenopodis TaxID=117903 RepID=A0A3S5FE39_9PLAT|nr:unnamed protein product [Protopolystoma xenopodis]